MLWLDRQQLATLFGRDYKTISKHINNALKEELADSEEVVAKFATTTQHGAMKYTKGTVLFVYLISFLTRVYTKGTFSLFLSDTSDTPRGCQTTWSLDASG